MTDGKQTVAPNSTEATFDPCMGILKTLHTYWNQTSPKAKTWGGDTFPATYLGFFAIMFRPELDQDASQKELNALIKTCNEDQEQLNKLDDLRKFCNSLKNACRSRFILSVDIYDWLCDFLQEDKDPEKIGCFKKTSYLANRIRQDYSRRRNRGGYEFSKNLRDALHKLMASDVIEARFLGAKQRIRRTSSFKLKSAPDRNAEMPDYEAKKDTVPHYFTKIRNGDPEHSGIITPKDTLDLVQRLLAVFNGWTKFSDLMDAAWNHVPHTMYIEPEKDPDEIGGSEDDSRKKVSEALDKIIQFVAEEKAEMIWEKICEVTRKEFFCLYILPETIGEGKFRLKDFGPPGTMSEQNKKVLNILSKELRQITVRHGKNIDLDSDALPVEDAKIVAKAVLRKLNLKCKENGFDTGLDMND